MDWLLFMWYVIFLCLFPVCKLRSHMAQVEAAGNQLLSWMAPWLMLIPRT